MKVCGFSFVKNAVKYDYPVVEAIKSILPLCDKFVMAIGDCDDGSEALIRSIDSPKIEIINTVWDPGLTERGLVLSSETNKAFDAISQEYDWCFYIQADEVIHEKYLPTLEAAMYQYLHRTEVDGLILKYVHFYGTYDYFADSRRWYRSEIRIIRNNKGIRSWNDAQGFRWCDRRKLSGVFVDAEVYHYGWVRPPQKMKAKVDGARQYWSSDSKHMKAISQSGDEFVYEDSIDSISLFQGSHPEVMRKRIEAINWRPKLSVKKKRFDLRVLVLYHFEKLFKFRPFENKHFIEIKN